MADSSGRTHLVIPDPHAHYEHSNERALWLGRMICDIKPDVVINLGDTADMPSMSGYDKGKRSFQGRTYKLDINAHADFQEKLWHEVRRRKKRMPHRVTLHGNHEYRIHRAIELQPELEGAIGFGDLALDTWYDDIVPYEGTTPGIYGIDGIHYAHYFVSGVMGRPVGGIHPARSLLAKQYGSCTAGHLHLLDYSVDTTVSGTKMYGLVAGCYMDYRADWAGMVNDLWWSGVIIKRNVCGGTYDLEAISIDTIKKEYDYT